MYRYLFFLMFAVPLAAMDADNTCPVNLFRPAFPDFYSATSENDKPIDDPTGAIREFKHALHDGNGAQLDQLLNSGQITINQDLGYQATPLTYTLAVLMNKPQVLPLVHYLLEKGASPNKVFGPRPNPPTFMGRRLRDFWPCAPLFICNDPDNTGEYRAGGNHPKFLRDQRATAAVITKLLLDAGARINDVHDFDDKMYRDFDSVQRGPIRTLFPPVRYLFSGSVRVLLEQGAKPNAAISDSERPLHLSCEHLRHMLNRYMTWKREKNQPTPGNFKAWKKVINPPTSVRSWKDKLDFLAREQIAIIADLLLHGANIHATDRDGRTAYQCAEEKMDHPNSDYSYDEDEEHPWESINNVHKDTILDLLEKGRDSEHFSRIHQERFRKQQTTLQRFREHVPAVNKKQSAFNNKYSMVKVLRQREIGN